MSATCDPLVREQTLADQSPARICIAYDIACTRSYALNMGIGTAVCAMQNFPADSS
jgi:hypothetical protein